MIVNRGRIARWRSRSMSAKSSRFCARTCSLALARPGMHPYVSLTPPVRRMSWCVLRTPTWTTASASRKALPTGKLRNRRPAGARSSTRSSSTSTICTPSAAQTSVMPLILKARATLAGPLRPPGLSATNGTAPACLSARSTQRSVSGCVHTAFSGAAPRSRFTLTAMLSPGETSADQPPNGSMRRSREAASPGPWTARTWLTSEGAPACACGRPALTTPVSPRRWPRGTGRSRRARTRRAPSGPCPR